MKIIWILITAVSGFCVLSAIGMNYLSNQVTSASGEIQKLQEEVSLKSVKINKLTEQVSILEDSVSPKDRRWAKIKQVRKAIQDTASVTKLSIVELTSIASSIIDHSEEFDVSISLILAVMRRESAFNKNAVSKAGAKGLMQLMDKTAEECAADVGVRHYNVFRIKDNTRLSTYYLWKMLDRFNNDLSLAVKAYNAGPTFVEKVTSGEYRDYPEETRIYERIVLKWKKEYEDSYGLH